jgi:hypothetical protein
MCRCLAITLFLLILPTSASKATVQWCVADREPNDPRIVEGPETLLSPFDRWDPDQDDIGDSCIPIGSRTYSTVRIWCYVWDDYVNSQLQQCVGDQTSSTCGSLGYFYRSGFYDANRVAYCLRGANQHTERFRRFKIRAQFVQ